MLEAPPISARQARRPLTIETPESILKVCSSAQVSSSTGPSRADDVPTVECEQAPPPAPVHPSPQTVVDYIDTPPPCSTSIQLFKSRTVDSDCGSLALEQNNDSSGEFGGAFAAPAATHDEAALVKMHTFIRQCAVRLRLQNECGPENVYIIKSQVLCSVSPWFSPVTPCSPTAARRSASRCGSRHRGLRRPRYNQVAYYPAPPRL